MTHSAIFIAHPVLTASDDTSRTEIPKSPYPTAVDAFATDSFVGASAINTAPMTTNTPDPIKNPVFWLAISKPNIDIVTACAKLDHAAKAITLRYAAGFRTAISRKIPSVT
jgi:hypothetical protein